MRRSYVASERTAAAVRARAWRRLPVNGLPFWQCRLTGDTLADVDTVTVRDLRNSGGEVLRRVERGEHVVITRDGTPVAELRPLPRSSAGPAELIRRRKHLPQVDPDALRRDVDNLIDSSL